MEDKNAHRFTIKNMQTWKYKKTYGTNTEVTVMGLFNKPSPIENRTNRADMVQNKNPHSGNLKTKTLNIACSSYTHVHKKH